MQGAEGQAERCAKPWLAGVQAAEALVQYPTP